MLQQFGVGRVVSDHQRSEKQLGTNHPHYQHGVMRDVDY
jgi:hypothetical protein